MKKIIPGGIAAALVAGGLLLAPAASATEVDSFGICVPSEAATETVVHPAVGEPTIVIKNPDYVPAVDTVPAQPAVGESTIVVDNPDYEMARYTPGWTEHVPAAYTPPVGTPTIDVEQENPDYVAAVPESSYIVHHEAETKFHEEVSHTEWKYVKLVGPGEIWLDNDTHKRVDGNGNKAEFGDWPIYQRTQDTRKVVDQEAYTETIKEAYDETVVVPGTPAQGEPTVWVTIDNPDYVAPTYTPAHEVEHAPIYTPAVGAPTIEVENPDYVPAVEEIPGTPAIGEPTLVVDNPDYISEREEIIEHDAVVCPVVDEPTADEPNAGKLTPIPAPAVKVTTAVAADAEEKLAVTGAETAGIIAGGTLAAALAGLGAALMFKRRRTIQQD